MPSLLILMWLSAAQIPLPEHPRPDFERAEWLNLNGRWRFALDARDEGQRLGWPGGSLPGNREILVPFSWGAPLSGVVDSADIGWYERQITVPEAWSGRRVFLVFGASDWRTTAWLDGTKLGEHQGGYTPFSFELPSRLRAGTHRVIVRVDDTPHPFKLEGKQGYGQARGLWQTVYLEARGTTPLAAVHFTPWRDLNGVRVDARLLEPAPRALTLSVTFDNREGQPVFMSRVARGATAARLDIPLPNAHRWSVDDPFLHEVTVRVAGNRLIEDRVHTYFGMRTISVVDLPGTNYPYVAINGIPVFLQLALDQAYHPTGYYTFPNDNAVAKSLDSTRLVEDNSPCCGSGHTQTDLNSWHEYLPGWRWEARVQQISDSTFPGSQWNFEPPWRQAHQPMLNSEFGNVWGYQGSTGDVDWSWDYHRAINAFRRHPKLAGWLYTEHHDVINEWNGYWRFDRSRKETGFGDIARGMTLRDLHAPLYIAVGDSELSRAVWPGERVEVPLYASFLTGSTAYGDSLTLRTELRGWNALGEEKRYSSSTSRIPYRPWMSQPLAPLSVTMPDEPATVVLSVSLEDSTGAVLHRNFTTFVPAGTPPDTVRLADGRRARIVHVPATAVHDAHWSLKQWAVLGDRKLDGTGSGYFEYRMPWPAGLDPRTVERAMFIVEASAKRLNGKDRDSTLAANGDYMRGGGFHDPSRNPNSYPMTGEHPFPSAVTVRVNGVVAGHYPLADDPADSRGILSWQAQPHDGHLYEAGSYGELLRVAVPPEALSAAARTKEIVVRLEVDETLPGGLAIYGARFGRYPVDPTVIFVLR